MPLSQSAATDLAKKLKKLQDGERKKLDPVRRYWTGRQALPQVVPDSAPKEVHVMARMARVNVLGIVVESIAQSLFVDGFRAPRDSDNAEVWRIWQLNRMPSRQSGIHRSTLAYGVAYAIALPGNPVPVIRGVSPRALTAEYGDDPDWAVHALERRGGGKYRLYDADTVYTFAGGEELKFVEAAAHQAGRCPVIRYLEIEDQDAQDEASDETAQWYTSGERLSRGEIAPLMAIQDQIDLITFNLLVAQHYSAFRQRYIIGWVADDEKAKAKASASQLWTFDEDPERMKVGEFEETNLEGYIKSREASLRHAASLSQTPAHELIGEMINLSAEALVAAEAGRDRKVADRQTMIGESHEQLIAFAGGLAGTDIPETAEVIWRDTSARSFAAIVDALGKLATMLGIPAEELWERVPNATQEEINRWRAAAAKGDAISQLTALLERQMGGGQPQPQPAPLPGPGFSNGQGL